MTGARRPQDLTAARRAPARLRSRPRVPRQSYRVGMVLLWSTRDAALADDPSGLPSRSVGFLLRQAGPHARVADGRWREGAVPCRELDQPCTVSCAGTTPGPADRSRPL